MKLNMKNIADLIDVNHPDGLTYREINNKLNHNINLGNTVSIDYMGVQLMVVEHARDCDGTPLYNLGIDDKVLTRGYSEDDLKIVGLK